MSHERGCGGRGEAEASHREHATRVDPKVKSVGVGRSVGRAVGRAIDVEAKISKLKFSAKVGRSVLPSPLCAPNFVHLWDFPKRK